MGPDAMILVFWMLGFKPIEQKSKEKCETLYYNF